MCPPWCICKWGISGLFWTCLINVTDYHRLVCNQGLAPSTSGAKSSSYAELQSRPSTTIHDGRRDHCSCECLSTYITLFSPISTNFFKKRPQKLWPMLTTFSKQRNSWLLLPSSHHQKTCARMNCLNISIDSSAPLYTLKRIPTTLC